MSPVYFQLGNQSEITEHLLFPLPPPAFFEWPWLLPLAKEPFLSVDIHPNHSPVDCAAHVPSGNPNPLSAVVTAGCLTLPLHVHHSRFHEATLSPR